MGKLTQYIDYLNIPPEKLNNEYVNSKYTHFSINDETKKIRKGYLKSQRDNKK